MTQTPTRDQLVEAMIGLSPTMDLIELRDRTRQLLHYRARPQLEKLRFEGTRLRGIPGFCGSLLPNWRRVLVTGGTGCVGQVVLANLAVDLPGAALYSLARTRRGPGQVPGVHYLTGDVRNPRRVAEVMEKARPDLVVHLAAQRKPDWAETHITETVSTNVYGTHVVLGAAGEAGVDTVVVASTGKAVRLFTSDVYAATKKLVEYDAARAAQRYATKVVCTRFTHVVDNSIVGTNLYHWISRDEPIGLHSPYVMLPIQSALECYQLLLTAGASAGGQAQVVALRDLGWPPIDLLDMTLDYLEDNPASASPIVFTGYPKGYESEAYPGTYDPLSAGDVSPLVNALEAATTAPTAALGDYVDHFTSAPEPFDALDVALGDIFEMSKGNPVDFVGTEGFMAHLLRTASLALLDRLVAQTDPDVLRRVWTLGARRLDEAIADHTAIHARLAPVEVL